MRKMQARLCVGSILVECGGVGMFMDTCSRTYHQIYQSRRRNRSPVIALAAVNGNQNHYAVLGLAQSASSIDIKRAYRLLARKYHPDVSKNSEAGEVFKSISLAYETLKNESTRTQYDRQLKFQEYNTRPWKSNQDVDLELQDMSRFIYRWEKHRRKMENDRFEEDEEEEEEEERGSFLEVLKSTVISLLLVKIFGAWISITYSSSMALFDRKLDSGYKLGHVIAWIMGGKGGILLTLCLSFASWVFGKKSSSLFVLIVVSMWIGTILAKYVAVPQGALITLLYMSIKLQVDLNDERY